MSLPVQLKRALRWLDDNILIVLSSFLLAFIPLYPKIPLRKLVLDYVTNPGLRDFLLPLTGIEEYIVRVRLEDLFILITLGLWAVWVLRKKVQWKSPLLFLIIAYAIVGAVSTVASIFIVKTVPLQPLHIGKTVLHYFRYLEYFSLFVLLYSAVKKRSHLVLGVVIFALTVLAISLYGYGQRYFYWPVYSTMNREASKGDAQFLTQYARVQSTFAGHYDMAAYLVIALPLLLALAYKVKHPIYSTGLHWIFWIGTWLLLLSASRAPFGAYLVGVGIVVTLVTLTKSSWKERIFFGLSRTMVFALCSFILIFYFGADMFERLSHYVNTQATLKSIVDQANHTRRNFITDAQLANHPLSQKKVLAMLPKGLPPVPQSTVDEIDKVAENIPPIASSVDQPPTPIVLPTPSPSPVPTALPAGVYQDIPDEVVVATVSDTGEVVYRTEKRARIYSKCALERELSLCIRLETLWPRAIEGFLSNPLTGTGYATLTKERVDEFTFADSTDNNFLRTLGETGILGFITFYGCVALVLAAAVKHITDQDVLVSGYSVGLLGGSIGLLLNAIYIDVFVASKVAQTYWALAGVFLGYIAVREQLDQAAQKVATIEATKAAPVTAEHTPNKPHTKHVSRKTTSSATR